MSFKSKAQGELRLLTDNWLMKKLDVINSTQDYAREMKVEDKQVVVVAQHQTNGYGRYGRVWKSIPGNLFASLVFPADKVSCEVTMVTCIALGQVMKNHGLDIQYKWVNDILIEGKKVSGILTEYYNSNLIIGFSVNIKHSPPALEATDLRSHGFLGSSQDVLDLFLKAFAKNYNAWLQQGFKQFRTAWKAHAYKLNQEVTISNTESVVRGIFHDIDDTGQIIIKNKEFITLNSGTLR